MSLERFCSRCAKEFFVGDTDSYFYKKMEVDEVSLCESCGIQQMMALRNDRVLYKRACDKCGKNSLSLYHPNAPYVVYCHNCWWSDDWEALDYGMEYDPQRPLIDQFLELQRKVPREALITVNSVNSEYGNNIRDSKNVYFGFQIAQGEDIYYCAWVVNSRSSFVGHKILESERTAYCFNIVRCYNSVFVEESSDSTDCYFSYDLRGCNNCILSSGLRNKSYYVRNQPVSKEVYELARVKLINGSFRQFEELKEEYEEMKSKAIHRYASSSKSFDFTGNYAEECNDVRWCFFGVHTEQSKAVANILNSKNVYYGYAIGPQSSELLYGVSVVKGATNSKLCFNLFNTTDCILAENIVSSSFCLASSGIKKKDYCILNTQYSKEEYLKIKNHLKEQGELARFLPIQFSTFGYNESAAQDSFPMTKTEALQAGFSWQEDIPLTSGKETMSIDQLPDSISDTPDTILEETLRCQYCTRNYRVVSGEFLLSRQLSVPISRICPQCRIDRQIQRRLPFLLVERQCMCDYRVYQNTVKHPHHSEGQCPNTFQTSYAPERPEIVYCEQCYNAEIL